MNSAIINGQLLTNQQFAAIKEYLYSNLKGDAVILSLKNGKYYGLNTVGASVWAAIQEPRTFQEIQSVISEEYEVDEETCRHEILSFLEKMTKENLVDILNV